MDNLECAMAVLAAHREARQWDDRAVAMDMLAQLGMKPDGEAKNAVAPVPPGITEDEVLAHEAAAKEATDKAAAARAELNARLEAEDKAKADAATDQAKAAKDARDAAAKDAASKPEPVAKADAPKPGVAGPMTSAQLDNPAKG